MKLCIFFWTTIQKRKKTHFFGLSYFPSHEVLFCSSYFLLVDGLRFSKVRILGWFLGEVSLFLLSLVYMSSAFHLLFHLCMRSWFFDCRVPIVLYEKICFDLSLLFCGMYPYKGCFPSELHLFLFSSAITYRLKSGEAIPPVCKTHWCLLVSGSQWWFCRFHWLPHILSRHG